MDQVRNSTQRAHRVKGDKRAERRQAQCDRVIRVNSEHSAVDSSDEGKGCQGVGRAHSGDLGFGQFGPDGFPVMGAKALTCHSPIGGALDQNAVRRIRHATVELGSPLADLGVALDRRAEFNHASTQCRNTER